MTTDRPEEDALCRLMNGADRSVDVYVNYHDEAAVTVEPEEDGPVFSIDSDADGTFGTYTFEAREKDDPDGEVLASASVEFEAGECYTAVFHPTGSDEYQLSVYGVDFSPSAASRLQIHHVGYPEQVDWTIAPKPGADPRISVDERGGTLERGECQQAIDVTENEYRLEILVDGEVVAFEPDLELEAEQMLDCFVVGDPKPEMGSDRKQAHVFSKRYHIPKGPEREAETTAPAEPLSTTDDNRPVEFDCESPELYETDANEIGVEITDPDGIVTGLGIDAVEPDADGIRIADGVVHPTEVGEPMTATLAVDAAVPAGSYDVRLVSNPDGVGQRVAHTVPVEVEPITVDRLWDRVEHHRRNGRVTDEVASELFALLRDAGASPDEGVIEALVDDVLELFDPPEEPNPRKAIDDVATLANEKQGDGIDEVATDDLVAKAEVLLGHLDSQ